MAYEWNSDLHKAWKNGQSGKSSIGQGYGTFQGLVHNEGAREREASSASSGSSYTSAASGRSTPTYSYTTSIPLGGYEGGTETKGHRSGGAGAAIFWIVVIVAAGLFFLGHSNDSSSTHQTAPTSTRSSPSTGQAESPQVDTHGRAVNFPPGTQFSAVFYPDNGKMALAVNGQYLVLNGVEALRRQGNDYASSVGFKAFAWKILHYDDASLECGTMGGSGYRCFLVTPGGRYDIAKFAINMGAAKAVAGAPQDYDTLEREARANNKGNWGGA